MRKSHEVVIEQNGKIQHYKVACTKPAACPLCDSIAETRATISFVK